MKKAFLVLLVLVMLCAALGACNTDETISGVSTESSQATSSAEQTSSVASIEESSSEESSYDSTDTNESDDEAYSDETTTDETTADESANDSSEEASFEESEPLADFTEDRAVERNYSPDSIEQDQFYSLAGSFDDSRVAKTTTVKRTRVNSDDILYFVDWDEYVLFPDIGDNFSLDCAVTVKNTAWIFECCYSEEGCTVIRQIKLDDAVSFSLISLERYCNIEFLRCNMINEQEGFLLVFAYKEDYYDSFSLELAQLFRTTDGGVTWESVESSNKPTIHYRNSPIFLQFFDQHTGIFSCSYVQDEDMAKRTYVTHDGGKTWELINDLPYEQEMDFLYGYTELEDLNLIDDKYYMLVEVHANDEITYSKFVSTDLINWELIE